MSVAGVGHAHRARQRDLPGRRVERRTPASARSRSPRGAPPGELRIAVSTQFALPDPGVKVASEVRAAMDTTAEVLR